MAAHSIGPSALLKLEDLASWLKETAEMKEEEKNIVQAPRHLFVDHISEGKPMPTQLLF